MTEVHYGVVRVGSTWAIIGDQLRVGAYSTRREAEARKPTTDAATWKPAQVVDASAPSLNSDTIG